MLNPGMYTVTMAPEETIEGEIIFMPTEVGFLFRMNWYKYWNRLNVQNVHTCIDLLIDKMFAHFLRFINGKEVLNIFYEFCF